MTLIKKTNQWKLTGYTGQLFKKEDYPRSVEYFVSSTKPAQTGEITLDSFTVQKTGLYTLCFSIQDISRALKCLFICPIMPGYFTPYTAKSEFIGDRCNTTQSICARLNKGDTIIFKSYQIFQSGYTQGSLRYDFQVVLLKDLTKIEQFI